MSLATGDPCPCGGSNANCYRCFGTGTLEPISARRSHSRVSRALGANSSPSRLHDNEGWIACPHCGVAVRRLKRHVKRQHGDKVVPVSASPIRQSTKTPVVPTRTVKRSIRTLLPPEWYAKRVLDPLTCPRCSRTIQAFRLPRHLLVVHKVALAALKAELGGGSPATQRLVRLKGSSHRQEFEQAEAVAEPSSLDGSRGYAPFREDGKFGSHPAHDDYSDESEP
jgi:hypothetical protein